MFLPQVGWVGDLKSGCAVAMAGVAALQVGTSTRGAQGRSTHVFERGKLPSRFCFFALETLGHPAIHERLQVAVVALPDSAIDARHTLTLVMGIGLAPLFVAGSLLSWWRRAWFTSAALQADRCGAHTV